MKIKLMENLLKINHGVDPDKALFRKELPLMLKNCKKENLLCKKIPSLILVEIKCLYLKMWVTNLN